MKKSSLILFIPLLLSSCGEHVHNLVHVDRKDATCTEHGYFAYDYCTDCDYTTYVEIAPINHTFEYGKCSVCGYELGIISDIDLSFNLDRSIIGYLYENYDFVIKGNGLIRDNVVVPNKNQIRTILIDEGITKIGKSFFEGFSNEYLKISLPSTLEEIGESAFSGVTAKSIEIKEGLKVIRKNAFKSALFFDSLLIPDSVEYIEQNAFYECKCSEFKAPSNAVLEEDALYKIYTTGNEYEGFRYIASNSNPHFMVTTSNRKPHVFNIHPDTEIIGREAYSLCDSEIIELPETVKQIEWAAFAQCYHVKSITIPSKVTRIAGNLFSSSFELQEISIPAGIKSIGGWAFDACYDLTTLYYGGTKAEFDAIDKEEDWDLIGHKNSVKRDTITLSCSDGNFDLKMKVRNYT